MTNSFYGHSSLYYFLVGFMKLGKHDKAIEAFTLAEQVHFTVYILQAKRGLWNLDDAPSMITTDRNDYIITALILDKISPKLMPNVLVRWKCLYSELRIMLMSFGLSTQFSTTFSAIDVLRRSGRLQRSKEQDTVVQQHHKMQKEILQEWGPAILAMLSEQSPAIVQKVLEPNEAILEFTIAADIPFETEKPSLHQIKGIILMILPDGEPILEIVDFREISKLVAQWNKSLNESIASLSNGKNHEEVQKNANEVGKALCSLLFPPTIVKEINNGKIECLYISLDGELNNLPLDILPWTDGKLLFEKVSISYLSTCREALREWYINILKQQLGQSMHMEEPKISVTKSTNTDCVIFANPDYNLETKASQEEDALTLWELMKQSLAELSSQKQNEKMDHIQAKPLQKSMQEANEVEYILSIPEEGILKTEIVANTEATITRAMEVDAPFLLHFSTHGFANPSGDNFYGGNFWTNMTTGLALAGFNTYHSGKKERITLEAGTGELTAMAVCGMNLRQTRLVYLSVCKSSVGFITIGESVGNMAYAFRAAGAETVISTLWPVMDDAARNFAVFFYDALCKKGTKPSQALVQAKLRLQKEPEYGHWFYWAPFVCVGYNNPLFYVE